MCGCIKCLNMDYVNEIRYQTYDKGLKSRVSVVRNNTEMINKSLAVNNLDGDAKITLDALATMHENNRDNSVRSMKNQKNIFYIICCCLSSTHKNDFYDNNRRKTLVHGDGARNETRGGSRFGFKKFRSQSRNSSFFTNGNLANNKAHYINNFVFSDENVKLTSNFNQIDDDCHKNNQVKFMLKEKESSLIDNETRKSSINQNSDQEILFESNNKNESCYSDKDQQKSLDNIFEMETFYENR
jgi:hypothetical protein